MQWTGKKRKKLLFFTQYEYSYRGWRRPHTPYDYDRWPLCFEWTLKRPDEVAS